MPKTRAELQFYFKEIFGLNLVDKAVVPGHQSPLDFVSDVFFEKVTNAMLIAPRGGGKTIAFAALHILNSRFKNNCDTCAVGTTKDQAKCCYDEMDRFMRPFDKEDRLIEYIHKEESVWKNGSRVKILPGTKNAMNGPHPQKVFGDEIDLMPWDIFQQMNSMSKNKNGIAHQDILGSTRKYAWGTITKILTDSPDTYKLYLYNVWDVIERCTKTSCDYCKTIVKGKWSNGAPRTFYDVCYDPELGMCKAKLGKGFQDIPFVISKFQTLDKGRWDAEWECLKPQRQGTVFYWYNENTDGCVIDKFQLQRDFESYPVFECIDWGGKDPYVCLYVQQIDNNFIIFDEIYVNEISDQTFAQLILKKREELGLTEKDIKKTYADPSSVSGRIALRDNGINVQRANNDILDGVNTVNVLGEDGRVKVSRKCKNTRREFNSYHWHENSTSNKPVDEDNHTCDAFRYLIYSYRGVFLNKSKSNMLSRPQTEIMAPRRENKVKVFKSFFANEFRRHNFNNIGF